MTEPLDVSGRHSTHRDIGASLAAGGRSFSFEFFPPKTDAGEQKLWQTLRELESLHPTFASVTYGAGGSTQDRTIRLTARMAQETTLTPLGHLTCVGATVDQLHGVVAGYADAGVHNILALRGDPQAGPGSPWQSTPGGIDHADELVGLVRGLGNFSVGVAAFPEGHPESATLDDDAITLARKADAGASFAITQFFFRARDYVALVDRAAAHGCRIPIVPGIMPVTNLGQIQRFAQLSGAQFPAELAQRFEQLGDDPPAVVELGVELASELSRELLDADAPGLHFYTLNASRATREIYDNLGLRPARAG
jgi:methylenetetrahydrofolate reductase (NADPH)